MIKEAINRVIELARDPVVQVNGRKYNGATLAPILEPLQQALGVSTLDSLIEYLSGNPDGLIPTIGLILLVQDTHNVALFSQVNGDWKNRHNYVHVADRSPTFNFGQWINLESFLIQAQTFFSDTNERNQLIHILGNVREETTIKRLDDGMSQQVETVEKVAGKVDEAPLPRVIRLNAWRTFPEIGAIPGEFVFRMQKGERNGPVCALFETAERVWEREAIERIKEYLETKASLFSVPVVIMA